MLPFLLSPAFKDYLWGGTNLKKIFNKKTELPIVAESWELSAHPDGDNIITSGSLKGEPFSEFVKNNPKLLGTKYNSKKDFPILIKLIDAKKDLSIQVHPDDSYANKVGNGLGKTEMWYVLDYEPGAFLYLGFKHKISVEEMDDRIANNTITEVLEKVPVKKGDVFFIEAGTIHAIGAGILLAEIQQNSNTTYRVYDFGRLGVDGKPRELHLERAKDVARLCPANFVAPGAAAAKEVQDGIIWRLASCNYFNTYCIVLNGDWQCNMDGTSFISLICTDGSSELFCSGRSLPIKKGDSVFVPADNGAFTLTGNSSFLVTTL